MGFTCEELVGLLSQHPSVVAHYYYTEVMGNPPNSQVPVTWCFLLAIAGQGKLAEQSRTEQTKPKTKCQLQLFILAISFVVVELCFCSASYIVLCNFNVDFCCKKLKRHENTLQPCDHRKW
jgi:hypothetical protein